MTEPQLLYRTSGNIIRYQLWDFVRKYRLNTTLSQKTKSHAIATVERYHLGRTRRKELTIIN
jgi:hypothetical protein